MRLFIAEKPSLAFAIAAALPGSHHKSGLHLVCSTGDIIAWCAGHVLEMAPPEDYSPELRSWTFETLPIVPERWQHRVTKRELVESIRRLLRKATRVVHAGDPDREGQLLVDEVLLHLDWRGPTDRLLVTDLTPVAMRRALSALEPNERYRPLCDAALARQRADWLYGLNLTRLYTLRARLAGYPGVLSVGRVQTPLLGLIVRRDREIERFVSRPHYGVEATLATEGSEFVARWAVGKEHEGVTDPEGRLLSRDVAEAVSRRTPRQTALVVTYEQTPHADAPPLPYSLAELQIDAGRRLGLGAAQVLDLAQRLYERQLITYPRSDCSYLPEEHFGQARAVLQAIAKEARRLAHACAAADPLRRGKAWDDGKVTAHHALIPTAESREASPLHDSERAIYELVAQRYVLQFLPPFEYLRTSAELVIAGETFQARGRQIRALGWKALDREPEEDRDKGRDDGPSDEREDALLPPLRIGQKLMCTSAVVTEKKTQPPKAFTDSTLIQAMCNVGKYISDPAARRILRDTDGIGTPATRAAIIETLFERGYVERRGKKIQSTTVGRGLIDALPEVATTPDLTAVWESAMRRINDRELDLGRFLGAVTGQLGELVSRGKAQGALVLPAAVPTSARPARPRRPPGKGRKATSTRARRAPARARASGA